MKTLRVFLIALLSAFGVSAQLVTPNTTLCGAITAQTTSICLTATSGSSPSWSIVNQTGIYVDNEFMLVQLSNSQVIAGTSQYVPVSRSNRSGPGAPQAHANGAVAWVAMVGNSSYPGVNGFAYGTSLSDVGACTRATQAFLPHIWVDRGVKRDCSSNTISTTSVGQWVDYNDLGDPGVGGLQSITGATVAVTISPTSGNYLLKSTGVTTVTLAAPVTGIQDGTVITFTSTTAQAHVISASGLIQNGATGGPFATATLAAFAGASITLKAVLGKWVVVAATGVVTYA